MFSGEGDAVLDDRRPGRGGLCPEGRNDDEDRDGDEDGRQHPRSPPPRPASTRRAGERTATTKSYVGTVTEYVPGKSIQVMTGEKDMHSFDLDEKDDVVSIDAKVAVGSKVQLVQETNDSGGDRITVTIAPSA